MLSATELNKKMQNDKATKTLTHSLRMGYIAIQIMNNKEITLCSQQDLLKLSYNELLDKLGELLKEIQ